jgi:hypothetical protein
MMPRRTRKRLSVGIGRQTRSQRARRRNKRVYAPLTPWVCHPWKRPRIA